MQRFLRPVLFWGAMVALIGATLIEWQSTLSEDFKQGISFLLMVVAAGALWLAYRIRRPGAGAWMERSRLRLVLASVVLIFAFSKGYFLLRDTCDLLHILPCKNWWQKEQTDRDIDVVEACAYDETHQSHDHRLSLQSLENHHARHPS
jgi:hypothetical protein